MQTPAQALNIGADVAKNGVESGGSKNLEPDIPAG